MNEDNIIEFLKLLKVDKEPSGICVKPFLKILSEDFSEKDQRVIKLLFGFEDGINKTNSQVAKLVGISPQRVSQIKIKTIKKLRHPVRIRLIFDN